jgi:hypothetical protein
LPKSTTTSINYLQLRKLQKGIWGIHLHGRLGTTTHFVQIGYLEKQLLPSFLGWGGWEDPITKAKAMLLFPPDVLD